MKRSCHRLLCQGLLAVMLVLCAMVFAPRSARACGHAAGVVIAISASTPMIASAAIDIGFISYDIAMAAQGKDASLGAARTEMAFGAIQATAGLAVTLGGLDTPILLAWGLPLLAISTPMVVHSAIMLHRWNLGIQRRPEGSSRGDRLRNPQLDQPPLALRLIPSVSVVNQGAYKWVGLSWGGQF